MRISTFPTSTFFLSVSLAAWLIPPLRKDGWGPTPRIQIMVYCYFFFIGCITFLFAIIYGKYYVLTEDGVKHKVCGICYRTTPWNRMKDVARVKQQTGERGTPKVLMVTTAGEIFRPEATGYVISSSDQAMKRRFWKAWLSGKIFMVRCNVVRNGEKVVPYFESHYGPLDYDFFEEENRKWHW